MTGPTQQKPELHVQQIPAGTSYAQTTMPSGQAGPLEAYEMEPPVRDEVLEQSLLTLLGDDLDRFAVVIKNLDDE